MPLTAAGIAGAFAERLGIRAGAGAAAGAAGLSLSGIGNIALGLAFVGPMIYDLFKSNAPDEDAKAAVAQQGELDKAVEMRRVGLEKEDAEMKARRDHLEGVEQATGLAQYAIGSQEQQNSAESDAFGRMTNNYLATAHMGSEGGDAPFTYDAEAAGAAAQLQRLRGLTPPHWSQMYGMV